MSDIWHYTIHEDFHRGDPQGVIPKTARTIYVSPNSVRDKCVSGKFDKCNIGITENDNQFL